jgi:hypothetical protein
MNIGLVVKVNQNVLLKAKNIQKDFLFRIHLNNNKERSDSKAVAVRL